MQIKNSIGVWAGKNPERVALAFPQTKNAYTYCALVTRVTEMGDALLSLGVSPGQVVAIVSQDAEKSALYLLALLFIGAMPAPVDASLSTGDLQGLLEFLEPACIIVPVNNTGGRGCVQSLAGYVAATDQRLDDGVFMHAGTRNTFGPEPSILLPTSGTTGAPKVVQILSSSIIANAVAVADFLDITERDTLLSLTSLNYCHGFYNGILLPLLNGAGTAVLEKFDIFTAARFWDIVSDNAVSVVNIVPSMLKMVLGIRYDRVPETPALRFFICGTARLPSEDKKAFEARYNVSVYTQFGTTESLINTINTQTDKEDAQGVAVGCGLAVVGPDNVPLPAGNVGEVVVSGKTVTPGYFKNEALSSGVICNRSLYTGDLGCLDQDGFLYIMGRKKEMINRGGVKVFPDEVDRILRLNGGVAESYTIGMPDEAYGEEIYTFVVLKKDGKTDVQELYDFLRGKLPKNKTPKEVIFMDEIPKGPTGKPKFKALKEALAARK